MSSRYTGVIQAKTGEDVLCLSNGTTLYSRYNPQRDCDLFASSEAFTHAGCFVIGGVGNGAHLASLREKYPEAVIIAVEPDTATLQFLQNQNLLPPSDEKLHITTFDQLKNTILQMYLPALHGNFCVQSLRSWENALSSAEKIAMETTIRESITLVSRDYGVQAHFGKLWNKNILNNFKFWCQQVSEGTAYRWQSPTAKRCLVLAAGPSLHDTLSYLAGHGDDDRWLIAVDTALPVLLKAGIIPHLVVTIDPQIASMRHFLASIPDHSPYPILCADLCATPGAARLWAQRKKPVLFFNENHPLGLYCSSFISSEKPPFINVSAGAGTVTHSAVELAYALGFSSVELAGADFGFPGNRPYARGTYLEDQWLTATCRTKPLEQWYDQLMFRTPLQINPRTGCRTTQVLDSYRQALEVRLTELESRKKDLPDTVPGSTASGYSITSHTFSAFGEKLLSDLEKSSKNALFSVLPLAAHLKSKTGNSDTLDKDLIVSAVKKHLR